MEDIESGMESVMQGLSAEQREKALKLAHKYGIPEGDPVWEVVLLALEAQDAKTWSGQAAQAAGEAADRVRDSIVSLPSVISRGAADGAGQVKQIITDAGVEAGAEVKKAGFEVGKTLIGAIRTEADKFHSSIAGDSEAAKESVLSTIKSEIARTVGHAVKTEWTKTLTLSVVFIVCLIIGAGGIGYEVKSINDGSCVGSDRHVWINDGQSFCMVKLKETK